MEAETPVTIKRAEDGISFALWLAKGVVKSENPCQMKILEILKWQKLIINWRNYVMKMLNFLNDAMQKIAEIASLGAVVRMVLSSF
ncbi:hypothetical protein Nepgr_000772 [Nepenthes gracilis]|uniref:Uncharacterized protein n=1 Tax=Nepenthes gracilis TaxID=150966 RepID=A0AAD3P3Z3_NEPGR|nr:hypothetical protein Nepgr_000772 [Nepenthes gracilis]